VVAARRAGEDARPGRQPDDAGGDQEGDGETEVSAIWVIGTKKNGVATALRQER
jgi:hypothetical protein